MFIVGAGDREMGSMALAFTAGLIREVLSHRSERVRGEPSRDRAMKTTLVR
jgi:hypothetical protein